MVTKDKAKRYLSDVPPEQCFWVNNGQILKNVEELANVLTQMSEETFHYHANKDKNDFSNWTNDVIGDKKLANDLLSSRNKESALKKVSKRLSALKKHLS